MKLLVLQLFVIGFANELSKFQITIALALVVKLPVLATIIHLQKVCHEQGDK